MLREISRLWLGQQPCPSSGPTHLLLAAAPARPGASAVSQLKASPPDCSTDTSPPPAVPPSPPPESMQSGAVFITVMLFMAVTASGSAELIAVSSLFAYDGYR